MNINKYTLKTLSNAYEENFPAIENSSTPKNLRSLCVAKQKSQLQKSI